MNLAFSALFLVLLISPGVLFVGVFSKVSWGRSSENLLFTKNFFWALILACLFHSIGLSVSNLWGCDICYEKALSVLAGDNATISKISRPHLHWCMVYFSSLWVISYFLGWVFQRILIGWAHIDRKLKPFRFSNHWQYLLSGELVYLKDSWNQKDGGSVSQPDLVLVSAVVSHADKTYLYRGVLVEYHFDNNGDPTNLVLAMAMRRDLNDDRQQGEAHDVQGGANFYNIIGNRFILEYKYIRTLNVQYVWNQPGTGN